MINPLLKWWLNISASRWLTWLTTASNILPVRDCFNILEHLTSSYGSSRVHESGYHDYINSKINYVLQYLIRPFIHTKENPNLHLLYTNNMGSFSVLELTLMLYLMSMPGNRLKLLWRNRGKPTILYRPCFQVQLKSEFSSFFDIMKMPLWKTWKSKLQEWETKKEREKSQI